MQARMVLALGGTWDAFWRPTSTCFGLWGAVDRHRLWVFALQSRAGGSHRSGPAVWKPLEKYDIKLSALLHYPWSCKDHIGANSALLAATGLPRCKRPARFARD